MVTRHVTRILSDGSPPDHPSDLQRSRELPGVTRPGGTYTFELIPLQPDLVRVFSRDRLQVYFSGFTRQVPRPAGLTADRPVTFGETLRGLAPRIQTWYPPDLLTGHAFIYPTAPR